MPDDDKTFRGSLVLDLRIWWRHMHTLYSLKELVILCYYALIYSLCSENGVTMTPKHWLLTNLTIIIV